LKPGWVKISVISLFRGLGLVKAAEKGFLQQEKRGINEFTAT